MFRPWGSVAFRLALNYGALIVITLILVLAVFYVQTVGVLQQRIDRQITLSAERLLDAVPHGRQDDYVRHIQRALRDGENSDTEIYLLLDPRGVAVVGNIAPLPAAVLERHGVAQRVGVVELPVVRQGHDTVGRLQIRKLADGAFLVVGSDMHHQQEIERLFRRASFLAALVALMMALGGAYYFQREVDRRAAGIRRVIARVGEGRMGARIAVSGHQDEFTRLSRDLNGMLDQLERLMKGVRHVSDTIAHNLRTPLTRILLGLNDIEDRPAGEQARALALARQELTELAAVFDKLLALAEVESGARRQRFSPVPMGVVVSEVLEFYEPLAEERGVALLAQVDDTASVPGDADLLASALANLVDNALKYTQGVAQARVAVRVAAVAGGVELSVTDNGPGIDALDRPRLGTHFFRAAEGGPPGHGLGLASVQAIVRLHGGELVFDDAAPGLRVRIVLPVPPA